MNARAQFQMCPFRDLFLSLRIAPLRSLPPCPPVALARPPAGNVPSSIAGTASQSALNSFRIGNRRSRVEHVAK